MPPESYTLVDHKVPNIVPFSSEKGGQSESYSGFSDWVIVGEESLASSSDATHLQEFRRAFERFLDAYHERDVFWAATGSLNWLTARRTQSIPHHQEGSPDIWSTNVISLIETRPVTETLLGMSFQRAMVDGSGGFPIELPVADPFVAESTARLRLDSALHASFEADPLESGMDHPAEDIINQAFHSGESQNILGWLREFCLDNTQPSFAASVMRCLGRQMDPGTDVWRARLVRDGLSMGDVEIRDAAVQAAESWGDPGMSDILASHSEPVTWLQDYILDVIDDLRE